ncbi:cysteine--tRNA ligase [Nesterenkonia aurantiaca]|uniref:Cysteine--tRNA ligase n=1 Tax=Nesterenkonia aurantiaca TaxID=1436010 RepID=A0A4R7FUH6_9MICC|nr:cysteine--tRNA ligase [Nesterenkonia aurantiaca]TDS82341.1 cysteinyl-tRNA synthetase [Nesterenkonia aurantiaca]
MALRLYDTKTATVRDFEPLEPGRVSLYYCGATVQGRPHVGHVRSAVAFDILIRWLEHSGLDVLSVRNVTDIDDKILEKSALSYLPEHTPSPDYPAQEPWFALAYRFEQAFHQAYDALGVKRPRYEPRATGHMTEMFALIQRLIDADHAYPAQDGSGDVYFDVRSWPRYGELTHQRAEDMQDAADADARGKRDPRDFALWKGHKATDPETARWDAPWGAGRPGWHVECSAMATKYLGSRFDIHGGGLDLRFPHHENELAQSGAAGDDFARFWLHNGMVTYAGEKMSKSVGNTIAPEEMLSAARPRAVRYFLGQAHYRSQLDYRPTSLQEAQAAVERIETFLGRAAEALSGQRLGSHDAVPEAFTAAMNDDLNVPQALAVLHETVRAGNIALDAEDTEQLARSAGAVSTMVQVLGLSDVPEVGAAGGSEAEAALGELIEALLTDRVEAKSAKDYARADAVRDRLTAAGIALEDSKDGTRWALARTSATTSPATGARKG